MLFQIYMTYSFWKNTFSAIFVHSVKYNGVQCCCLDYSNSHVFIILCCVVLFRKIIFNFQDNFLLQIYECFTETSTAAEDVFNLLICLWLSNLFSSKLFNVKLFSMLCTFISKAKRPIPKLQFSKRIFNIQMQDTQLVTLTPSVEQCVPHWMTHTVPLKRYMIYVLRTAVNLWKKDVLWKPLPATCNWLHVFHRLVLNCVLLFWCPSFSPSKTLWN